MRLTDSKRAAELKANADSLRTLGFEPTILDQRYIKLAEYEDAEELIRTTTDVEPVKHGKWKKGKYWDEWFCSVCRNYAYLDQKENTILPDDCPHCGARMDGD